MLERLKVEDFETLENLFPEVFKISRISDIIKNNPFTEFYVLKDNDKIVGFINFDVIYDRAELININVISDKRNNGYGSKLLLFMLDLLKGKVKNITLEVKVDNSIAINLYKKVGFSEKAIRKNYYNGIDGILMERDMM